MTNSKLSRNINKAQEELHRAMTLRFKSIPLRPDGNLDLTDVQAHQVRISKAACYLPPAWVAAGVFLISASVVFVICCFVRKCGYHLVSDDEVLFLPPFLGILSSLPAFTAALKAEVQLLMHMRTVADRNCDCGQFRFIEQAQSRKRV
jgi:hypothetical protein